jgi:protein TonB
MEPEMILQADVLDIIFDDRNKEYGAYELRSHYERRLKKSIAVVFLLIVVSILFFYWLNNIPHSKTITEIFKPTDTISLVTVEIDKRILQPELAHKRIATVQSTPPLIVRDKIITNPPPTIDDQNLKQIGKANIDGDLPSGVVQPVSDGNGKSGNTSESVLEEETVASHPDFMPEFPGGMEALQRYLSRNLKMPREDLEPGTKVPTLVRFVVDKDGTITGIEFEKSGGKDFDNEVARVIKKMPPWKPGKQNGKSVAVYFKLPVIFQVPDEN